MGRFQVYKFILVTCRVPMICPAKKILFVLYRALSQIHMISMFAKFTEDAIKEIIIYFYQSLYINCIWNGL